jgi:hypothetical protein
MSLKTLVCDETHYNKSANCDHTNTIMKLKTEIFVDRFLNQFVTINEFKKLHHQVLKLLTRHFALARGCASQSRVF